MNPVESGTDDDGEGGGEGFRDAAGLRGGTMGVEMARGRWAEAR